MKKRILILPLLATIFLVSCKENAKSEEVIPSHPSITTETKDSLSFVNTIVKNVAGEELQLIYKNANDSLLTVVFKGDSIQLTEKPAASGIWYANENYELRGKGEQVVLTKDGQSIFSNEE